MNIIGILRTAILAATLTSFAPANAQDPDAARREPPRQELKEISDAVESFLEREAAGLPGRVTVEVGKVDPRLHLAACAQLQAFFPNGSRPWGQTSVGVRCAAPSVWTVYVPARVNIHSGYLVAARPLAAGQVIGPGDVMTREGDLAQLPASVLVDPVQAFGYTLASGLKAGQPLRRDALRAVTAVNQGQLVAVYIEGPGFRISSEGRALAKAAEGATIQVRTASGAILSGIVRPGPVVEVLR